MHYYFIEVYYEQNIEIHEEKKIIESIYTHFQETLMVISLEY